MSLLGEAETAAEAATGTWWIKPAIYGGILLGLIGCVWFAYAWAYGRGKAVGIAQQAKVDQVAITANGQAYGAAMAVNAQDAITIAALHKDLVQWQQCCALDPAKNAAAGEAVKDADKVAADNVKQQTTQREKVYETDSTAAAFVLLPVPPSIGSAYVMRKPAPGPTTTADPVASP